MTYYVSVELILLCSTWLYELCRGNDREVVRARQLPKSLGCGKNFPGPTKLKSVEQVCYVV